jgi:hypothetical protein
MFVMTDCVFTKEPTSKILSPLFTATVKHTYSSQSQDTVLDGEARHDAPAVHDDPRRLFRYAAHASLLPEAQGSRGYGLELIPVQCRNAGSDACEKIAVGNNKSEAITACQVLECHSLDERRLASTGLPNDVYVQKTVLVFDAKDAIIIAKIDTGELCDLIVWHMARPLCVDD